MIKKILLLNIALFLFCSTSYGQYSLYKLQKEKISDKKEVKKPDEIENKTKGCELMKDCLIYIKTKKMENLLLK